jgi:hypothetical protein
MARLDELDATVIVACYGMSESFAGEAGLEPFESDLAELLATLTQTSFAPGGPPGWRSSRRSRTGTWVRRG